MSLPLFVRSSFTSSLILGLMATFVGCAPSDQPDLGQVTGRITLDDQPLVGVGVVFQPENGRPARGQTDQEGNYELTYIRNTKGAKVGKNRVEIAPSEEGESESEDSQSDESAGSPARKPSKSGKPLVPPRYNIKSELSAEVKPGKNTFNFSLESDKK